MSQDLELDDLSTRHECKIPDNTPGTNVPTAASNTKEEVDGTISAWTWTSSILLGILSSVLLLTPKFLLFAAGQLRTGPTPLEAFLALQFGIFLGAIAISLLLNMPSTDPLPPTNAYSSYHWHPSLVPLTSAGLLMSFLSYNTSNVGSLSLLWAAVTGTIGIWGAWEMMFAGQSSMSKKTGADKRTSAFIFGNQSAASALKKRWKRNN